LQYFGKLMLQMPTAAAPRRGEAGRLASARRRTHN
jgi:hypothetical protein